MDGCHHSAVLWKPRSVWNLLCGMFLFDKPRLMWLLRWRIWQDGCRNLLRYWGNRAVLFGDEQNACEGIKMKLQSVYEYGWLEVELSINNLHLGLTDEPWTAHYKHLRHNQPCCNATTLCYETCNISLERVETTFMEYGSTSCLV